MADPAERENGKTEGYVPIENYGVIGNLETVALVSLDGSIDFFCFPAFDSPTAFARILDQEKGGHFQICFEAEHIRTQQLYLPDTNILVTRFLSDNGILEVTDFMPLGEDRASRQIVRIVKAVRGDLDVRIECCPRFDYGRAETTATQDREDGSVVFSCDCEGITSARLKGAVPLEVDGSTARAHFELKEDEVRAFTYICTEEEASALAEGDGEFNTEIALELQAKTARFWREWVSRGNYSTVWQGPVKRSALALKLLFSHKHGSIVAAPTFGLPETMGGVRNWDYRYCWIRDSAFTIYAMLKLGFTDEAGHYVNWVSDRYKHCGGDGSLQLMYAVDGTNDLEEKELDHLEGYAGSQPVRIGNAANSQLQLDIYGELIDSIYLAHKFSAPMSFDGWGNLVRTLSYVQENWEKPDEGIWEFRGGKRHFLHSRLMCWVAMDRGMRLAEKASLPAPFAEWRKTRDAIFRDIHENFWDEELQSFVQHRGAKIVDASQLLMPLVKFISPVDKRWTGTMAQIKKQLVTDAFVMRYPQSCEDIEGFDGGAEGSFTMCSFWYAECLARAGHTDEARLVFEKMIGYGNHLGLYAEQLGFKGEHLGNFPQAFTHLALVSAAFALERSMENGGQPF